MIHAASKQETHKRGEMCFKFQPVLLHILYLFICILEHAVITYRPTFLA